MASNQGLISRSPNRSIFICHHEDRNSGQRRSEFASAAKGAKETAIFQLRENSWGDAAANVNPPIAMVRNARFPASAPYIFVHIFNASTQTGQDCDNAN
jgi:hypothetical protein